MLPLARLWPPLFWWGCPLSLILVAALLRDPLLFAVRDPATCGVLAGGLCGLLAGAARRMPARPLRRWLLATLWLAGPAWAVSERVAFAGQRHAVLAASGPEAREVGRHFMLGYRDVATVRPLAEAGLIAGIFVTRRNVAGRAPEALRAEIAGLQQLRRAAGLPPLLVATDQEGGIVSRLSPPLTALPPLADFAAAPPAARGPLAREYGLAQGRELAALGITMDFSPVVDLRGAPPGTLDLHSRIAERAISADPAIVTEIAAAYAQGLADAGVLPTLKHFPGLGRIAADTHLFAAAQDASPALLDREDWLPFREILAAVPAALMIGHVTITALDPRAQASQSPAVIQGLLRRQWGFRGLLVTDDFTMEPVYRAGLCASVRRALDAGMDLLLFSYDDDQYYPAAACALEAARTGRLDRTMLARTGAGREE